MARFGDFVRRVNTKEDRFKTDRIYYVGGEHIESNDLLVQSKGLIEGSTIGPMFYFGFKAGDILFVTRNPHLRKCAKVEFDGICSEKTLVLATVDNSRLLQDYLAIVMQSDDFWDYCEDNKSGGVNYFINWSTLEEYEFDLPSIKDQIRISNQVWAAYRLKEAYKRLIDATDEMVKSQFIEMFGGGNISLSTIEECANTFIDGDWIESKDQSESGIRLIQTGNVGNGVFKDKEEKSRFISEETFNRLHCTQIFEGDILVSRLPDPIGRACVVPQIDKAITAVDCTIIRLKPHIMSEFFITYTQTPSYQNQIKKVATGTTRRRISRANLAKIKIPFPTVELQKQFAAVVRQADKSKFELKQCIDNIDKVIKSLING